MVTLCARNPTFRITALPKIKAHIKLANQTKNGPRTAGPANHPPVAAGRAMRDLVAARMWKRNVPV